MGYVRKVWHTFNILEGSWWVLGTCLTHHPTSLSSNFVDVLPDVTSLLNYRVEWTVILNDTTQDNNKVLGDEIQKTIKFHSLEREAVSTFQSVIEAEQQNFGPQKKDPWQKMKTSPPAQTRNRIRIN